MDQLYDNDSNGLTENDAWRKLWVNTYRPGSISALVGKRVYTYSSGTSGTPSGQNDYTYSYDPVANVVLVFNTNSTGRGDETYYFAQDAFGLELSANANVRVSERTNLFGSTQWPTARTAGIWEHQTGKWIDPFTGDYYFQARWYDAGVGRFVGRDPVNSFGREPYDFSRNNPVKWTDETGRCPGCTLNTQSSPDSGESCPNVNPPTLTRHGNWCGGGSDLNRYPSCPAIDGVDACCLAHDSCYALSGVTQFTRQDPNTTRGRAKLCCDYHLCRCLRNYMSSSWMDPAVQSYARRAISFFCYCDLTIEAVGNRYDSACIWSNWLVE
jgi:RHS repeat-associated protein